MVTLILVESSLTKVPCEIKERRVVKSYSRLYGRFYDVLDVTALPPRMRSLVGPKHGRPDVVHKTVLSITDHPLFQTGRVTLYMHTLEGRIFQFSREVKPPRNYVRFLGLASQLLQRGWVGPSEEEALIWEVNSDLRDLMKGKVILLEESGELMNPLDFLRGIGWRNSTFLMGCFPYGEFSEDIRTLSNHSLALHGGVLSSSTSASMLLTYMYYLEVWSS